MAKEFSTAELADRWYDKRDIRNLAGKYVTSLLLKREKNIFGDFWSAADDICLGFNDGYYVGREAVSSYYSRSAEITAAKSKLLKSVLPEQLGDCSDDELYGVGQLTASPLTTPVIELAEDGKTAKGIWHIQGSDNTVTEFGPLSIWKLGFLCIDFIKEGDDWKIWHLLSVTNISCPMGENWTAPLAHAVDTDYESLLQLSLPEYTIKRSVYPIYTTQRPFTAPPKYPDPYRTFAETFSYGV